MNTGSQLTPYNHQVIDVMWKLISTVWFNYMCNNSWAHKVSYLGLNRTRGSYEKVVWSGSWRMERIWKGEGKSMAIILVATKLRALQCDGCFGTVIWQDVMINILPPISNRENITLRFKTHILVFLFPVFCSYLHFNWNTGIVFLNSTIFFPFGKGLSIN